MEVFRRFLMRYGAGCISMTKIAWSCALGVYLAFSPFLGVQTVLVFVFAFLLRARASIVFAVLYLVNNPWTMVPIFFLDYGVGLWFFNLCGIDWQIFEPSWMKPVSDFLVAYVLRYVGMDQIGLLPYFIGGHIVALPLAFFAFFGSRAIFKRHHFLQHSCSKGS